MSVHSQKDTLKHLPKRAGFSFVPPFPELVTKTGKEDLGIRAQFSYVAENTHLDETGNGKYNIAEKSSMVCGNRCIFVYHLWVVTNPLKTLFTVGNIECI